MKKPAQHFIFLLLLIITLWSLGRALHIDILSIRTWLAQYPLWLSGILYFLIYVGVTTFFWFGTIDLFRISGALLFGPYWSTLFVYIAEVCNANILFLISRNMGRAYIEQKFHYKDKGNKYSPETTTFWAALALRINPLVPFRFMDVGFGLSKISFRNYFWAVVWGSPLRILMMQFIVAGAGEAILKDPMAMMNYLQANRPVFMLTGGYFLAVFFVTMVAVGINFVKKKSI